MGAAGISRVVRDLSVRLTRRKPLMRGASIYSIKSEDHSESEDYSETEDHSEIEEDRTVGEHITAFALLRSSL